MKNQVKFSTISELNSLKSGDFYIKTGDSPPGSTSETGFYSSYPVPPGGYVTYIDKPSGGPSIYVSESDDEFIELINNLSGQNFTEISEATEWVDTRSDIVVVNKEYESVSTDGILVNLDAGFYPSIKTGDGTWKNLAGDSHAVLSGSYSFSSASGGKMILNGTSGSAQIDLGVSKNIKTLTSWFKLKEEKSQAIVSSDSDFSLFFNVESFSSISMNGSAFVVRKQSDGKILVAGEFTTFNGTTQNRIIRLNSDGNIDTTFQTGSGFSDTVRCIEIQSDGKIIIGGFFIRYNSITVNRIIRLNTDGSIDNTFQTGTGFNSSVFSMVIQSDGKIVLGGAFTTYNSTTYNRIIRLNSNGEIDTSFNIGSGINLAGNALALQNDGKIIVGSFQGSSYNGFASNGLFRLMSDGTRDSEFNIGSGFNGIVRCISVLPNGNILVGGLYTNFNGVGSSGVTVLSTTGTRITSLTIGDTFSLYSLMDGSFYVGSQYDFFSGVGGITKYKNDYTIDNSFTFEGGPNGEVVYSIDLLEQNNLIISRWGKTGRTLNKLSPFGVFDRTSNIILKIGNSEEILPNELIIDRWYFISVVRQNGSYKIKINNEELDQQLINLSDITGRIFYIGSDKNQGKYLNGEFINLMLYENILSDDKILLNYNTQKERTIFVSEWQVSEPDLGITLPLLSTGKYNMKVDWGDNTFNLITSGTQEGKSHIYSSAGTYVVKIDGIFEGIKFDLIEITNRSKIRKIKNWGNLTLINTNSFDGCVNLDIVASDAPEIKTTNISQTFKGCLNLTGNNSVNKWDVSNVTSIVSIFENTSFDKSIESWNIKNLQFAQSAFSNSRLNPRKFTKTISKWIDKIVSIDPTIQREVNITQQEGMNFDDSSEIRLKNFTSVLDVKNLITTSSKIISDGELATITTSTTTTQGGGGNAGGGSSDTTGSGHTRPGGMSDPVLLTTSPYSSNEVRYFTIRNLWGNRKNNFGGWELYEKSDNFLISSANDTDYIKLAEFLPRNTRRKNAGCLVDVEFNTSTVEVIVGTFSQNRSGRVEQDFVNILNFYLQSE